MKEIKLLCGLFIAGCTSGETKDSIETVDTSVAEPVELPDELIGNPPANDTPPPVFTALNYDGSTRNQDNLIGNPTVLWFFPFAGTPG